MKPEIHRQNSGGEERNNVNSAEHDLSSRKRRAKRRADAEGNTIES